MPEPDPVDPTVPPATVSFVIVALHPSEGLDRCLDSIHALRYPEDLVEVLVVDNSSTGSVAQAISNRERGEVVVPSGGNIGFAAAVNNAAQVADGRLLALVNDDVELDPEWLIHAIDAIDESAGYSTVATVVLDPTGQYIDFIGGTISFHGMGNQTAFGRPFEQVDVVDRADVPFANGAAMLTIRSVFLDVGGLDEKFFVYYDDVDLGWRLWMLGHGVRLAAKARAFHRHRGTIGGFPMHQRFLLYERNALRSLIKNVGEENLHRVLAAALFLLGERARLDADSDRRRFDMGDPDRNDSEVVPRVALSRLHALGDIIEDLDGLWELRQNLQLRRVRSDHEVFKHFGRPFDPLDGRAPYLEAWNGVIERLGLQRTFEGAVAKQVAIVVNDDIDENGRNLLARSLELAKELTKHVNVTILSRSSIALTGSDIDVVVCRTPEQLQRVAEEADIIIVQEGAFRRYPSLKVAPGLLVVDLYDSRMFDGADSTSQVDLEAPLDVGAGQPGDGISTLSDLLDVGDFFVCESAPQRDFWLGVLTAQGRLARGADWRDVIDVVPFALQDHPRTDGSEPLVRVLSDPARWHTLRTQRPRPVPPHEGAQLLLARRRRDIEELEKRVDDLQFHLAAARRKLDRLAPLQPGYETAKRLVARFRQVISSSD